MKRIVNIILHTKENLPNSDNVGKGPHYDRNNSHFKQPSFSKHTPGGFDSNIRINQGWFPRGIQLPNIDMRKFDEKTLSHGYSKWSSSLIYTRFQTYKR